MEKTHHFTGMLTRLLLVFCLALTSMLVQADLKSLLGNTGKGSTGFLSVDEAFQVDGFYDGQDISLNFTVTPGYYLYKYQFKFQATDKTDTLGQPGWPEAVLKYDPFQEKDVEVFPENFTLIIPLTSVAPEPTLSVTFQGCAEAGLCYPPKTVLVELTSTSSSSIDRVETTLALPEETSANITTSNTTTRTPSNNIAALFAGSSWLTILGGFFIAGILLSFTPCVLPMVPILSSIIVGAGETNRSRILMLTISYILGMAVMFTLAGILTGLFGATLNLQAQLQSPWVLVPFALLFAILSLSMFGLYELQLPSALRDKLEGKAGKQQGGSLVGALLLGIFSSLVVSPCVSAPLAGALVYISSTGDALLGGSALFFMALGMGTPLLIIGFGGSRLLPKAGNWMNGVRSAFGVLLLAVAIWLLERIIPAQATVFLWGCLLTGSGIFMGALNFTGLKGYAALRQVIGMILLIIGATQLVGAMKGADNPLQPLSFNTSGNTSTLPQDLDFNTVTTPEELRQALKKAQSLRQVAIVDFYADWCISCKLMERELFPLPAIRNSLEQMYRIRVDITQNTPAQQALLTEYQLFGPPALLFFSQAGLEQPALRLQGEPDQQILEQTLNKASGL